MIFGGYYDLLPTAATEYNSLLPGKVWHATEYYSYGLVSTDGVIKNLRVKLNDSPGAGKHYDFTLMVNGAPTALTLEIADAATSGSNMVNEIDVTGGDTVTLQCDPDGTPTARYAAWTCVFEGDTPNESLILGGSINGLNKAAIEYGQVMCQYTTWSATENDFRQVVPTAGTIKNFYVRLNMDPGDAPDAYRFTLRKGGVSQTLTVTITADDTTGSDLVNSFAVVAGDVLTLMVEPLNEPLVAPTSAAWGMTFVADTDGESIVLGGCKDDLHATATEYNCLGGWEGRVWVATENQRYALGQVCTLKKLHVLLSAAPGAGNARDFAIRIAGTNVVTLQISDAATTGDSGVLSDTVALDEYVNLRTIPTDTPDVADAYWGFVCYIAPPGPTTYEKTWQVDALFKRLGIEKPADVDVILQRLATTVATSEASHATAYDTQRKLVRLSEGTLYTIYPKKLGDYYQIYVKKSTDDGATWIDETRISTATGMADYPQSAPSIAVDSNGYLHAVWAGKATGFTTDTQIWYNKYTTSWAGPVRISTYTDMEDYDQSAPSIAVDSSNYLHVVWLGRASGFTTNDQVWYGKYITSWATPVRISTATGMDGASQWYPSIAVDSRDDLHAVWPGRASGYPLDQIWYAKYTTGWVTPIRISTLTDMEDHDQYFPSIAADSGDCLHVVWYGQAPGFVDSLQQIWYAKYVTSWSTPIRISTATGMDGYQQAAPSIAADSNDYLHVVWRGKATGYIDNDKVWYAKYETSWETPIWIQVVGKNGYPNLRWSFHHCHGGYLHYVFTEGTASPYNVKFDKDIAVTMRRYVLKTWKVDVLFKRLGIQKTPTIDAAFQKRGTELQRQVDALFKMLGIERTPAIDALLVLRLQKPIDLDVLFAKLGIQRTADVDTLLKRLGIEKTASIDALLKKLGIEKTADVDTLLKKLDIEKPLDIDTVLSRTYQKTLAIDASLSKTESKDLLIDVLFVLSATREEPFDIDVLLQKLGIEKTAPLDTLLVLRPQKSTSLDTLFKKLDIPMTAAVDAFLKKLGIAKTASVDTFFKRLGITKTAILDAVFLRTYERTAVLNAFFEKAVTKQAVLDAIFMAIQTKAFAIDVILTRYTSKSFGVDVRFWIPWQVATVELKMGTKTTELSMAEKEKALRMGEKEVCLK